MVMKALYGADIQLGKSLLNYPAEADRALAKANLDRALGGESIVEEAYSGDEERVRRFFEIAHDPFATPTKRSSALPSTLATSPSTRRPRQH